MHSCHSSTQVPAVKQQAAMRMRGQELLRRDKARMKNEPLGWLLPRQLLTNALGPHRPELW